MKNINLPCNSNTLNSRIEFKENKFLIYIFPNELLQTMEGFIYILIASYKSHVMRDSSIVNKTLLNLNLNI